MKVPHSTRGARHAPPLSAPLERGDPHPRRARAPHGTFTTPLVLTPPAADPDLTDDERDTIAEMMAKGTYAGIVLATADLDATFDRLQARDADVVQEPIDQPYGVRTASSATRPATGSVSSNRAEPPKTYGSPTEITDGDTRHDEQGHEHGRARRRQP